jgi:hypothetical protein
MISPWHSGQSLAQPAPEQHIVADQKPTVFLEKVLVHIFPCLG